LFFLIKNILKYLIPCFTVRAVGVNVDIWFSINVFCSWRCYCCFIL